MPALRPEFRAGVAAGLAAQAGLRRPEPWTKRGSDRFACFADASRLVMVAGPHEENHADLALAIADTALVLDRGRITYKGEARPLLVDLNFRKQKLWI